MSAPPVAVEAPTSRGRDRELGLLPVVTGAWIAVAGLLLAANVVLPALNTPAASGTPSSNAQVGGVISIEETFDDLPMDSSLPKPWQVSGGGTAAVAPLPTSVDRSVRVSSDPEGAPTEACRPTATAGTASVRVAFDYRFGRTPAVDTTLLELRAGSTSVLEVVLVAADGRIAVLASNGDGSGALASGAPEAGFASDQDAWHRIEMTVASSGEVAWQAHDTSGADAGSGTTLLDAAPRGLPDTVCLRSPAGSPAGWVAVDDLLIEG